MDSISLGNIVANQNKSWLSRSGISDKVNQQRVNASNAMAEQQSSMAWGKKTKKTKNKDYLRLKIDHVDISKESSKSE